MVEKRPREESLAKIPRANPAGHTNWVIAAVELANEYGIKAIIQPGGSLRDQESIDMCNSKGISMVFTQKRHFLH